MLDAAGFGLGRLELFEAKVVFERGHCGWN